MISNICFDLLFFTVSIWNLLLSHAYHMNKMFNVQEKILSLKDKQGIFKKSLQQGKWHQQYTCPGTKNNNNKHIGIRKVQWKYCIQTYIVKLKDTQSPDYDEIRPQLIKETSQNISKPLADLFDKSTEQSKLPSEWKLANILPIHKKKRAKTRSF